MKEMSFAMACRDYFGYLPGQTLAQFATELKALTAADRAELTKLFVGVGYRVT